MRRLNKLIIVAVAAIALLAFAGSASAKLTTADGLTVKVNTIQTNGVYHGIPVINSTGSPQVSYEYRLMPDGTYTIMGTVTNDNKDLTYEVWIYVHAVFDESSVSAIMSPVDDEAETMITVPPGTSASFSLTISAPSDKDISVHAGAVADKEKYSVNIDDDHISYTMQGDSSHTVDQGPMSDAVVIFTNGVPNYNGKPAYWIGLGP